MLVHFSTDDEFVMEGFRAIIHYIPRNAKCADFLNGTKLILNQVIDCDWVITAPSVTGTITVQFQYFEVCTIN